MAKQEENPKAHVTRNLTQRRHECNYNRYHLYKPFFLESAFQHFILLSRETGKKINVLFMKV